MERMWRVFIDSVSVLWLGVFAYTMAAGDTAMWVMVISCVIAGIYVIDLILIARKCSGVWDFIKRAWLDLLMLIPFFRIFRVCRLFRLVRASRVFSGFRRIILMERAMEGMDTFYRARGLLSGRLQFLRMLW